MTCKRCEEEADVPQLICAYCHQEFPASSSQGRVQRFCSGACKQKDYYHRNRDDVLARKAAGGRVKKVPNVMPAAEAKRLRAMVDAQWKRR